MNMRNQQYLWSNDAIYTPWFPRRADHMIVSAQLIEFNNTLGVEIFGFTKNRDEVGDGVQLVAQPSISLKAVGKVTEEWTALKELVRYKIQGASTKDDDYYLFRLLPVTWYDAVDAS